MTVWLRLRNIRQPKSLRATARRTSGAVRTSKRSACSAVLISATRRSTSARVRPVRSWKPTVISALSCTSCSGTEYVSRSMEVRSASCRATTSRAASRMAGSEKRWPSWMSKEVVLW